NQLCLAGLEQQIAVQTSTQIQPGGSGSRVGRQRKLPADPSIEYAHLERVALRLACFSHASAEPRCTTPGCACAAAAAYDSATRATNCLASVSLEARASSRRPARHNTRIWLSSQSKALS